MLNLTNMTVSIDNGKSSIRKALEDAFVVGAAAFFAAIAAVPYPPTLEALWVPSIVTVGVAILTYAKARNIEISKTE